MASSSSIEALIQELQQGSSSRFSIGLLQALHIVTRDKKINQDSRRKLKQVQHLLQFIIPSLEQALQSQQELTLVDHGAGKSYLGFLLYDQVFRQAKKGWVHGIEARADLVERSQSLAKEWGFDRMRFHALTVQQAIDSADIPSSIDWVTALHACDSATDDALDFALKKRAKHILLVPCCQAEVAAALRSHKAHALSDGFWAELWRHPLHTREFGSQLTNVLRCLKLEASGYRVTVTELTGWEHSMKNELIVAEYTGHFKQSAAERLNALLAATGLTESMKERFAPHDKKQ